MKSLENTINQFKRLKQQINDLGINKENANLNQSTNQKINMKEFNSTNKIKIHDHDQPDIKTARNNNTNIVHWNTKKLVDLTQRKDKNNIFSRTENQGQQLLHQKEKVLQDINRLLERKKKILIDIQQRIAAKDKRSNSYYSQKSASLKKNEIKAPNISQIMYEYRKNSHEKQLRIKK